MLKVAEIKEGKLPLGYDKQLALVMLVRRYKWYNRQQGRFPDLEGKIASVSGMPGSLNEISGGDPDNPITPSAPTADDVKGMALDATVTRIAGLPEFVVEDEGTDKEKSFFGTVPNWEELAQGVLDILYPVTGQSQVFLVVQRTMRDYGLLGCGPRDELITTVRRGY